MSNNLINKIKQKKEFSGLPNSIVDRVSRMKGGDVRESRALLRKYFGVFLTNKILKGKISPDEMLIAHISSRKRDYRKFYEEIFSDIDGVNSVIDLGCGVNGFSYKYLKRAVGNVDYIGIEATGQLVDHMNKYFSNKGFSARAIVGDLFDVESVLNILKTQRRKRVVFLFQVVDALESLERDFSKKFILKISKECEKIVLSLSTESLGGRKKFMVQRKWLIDFLAEHFVIERNFVMSGEKILVFGKK